MARSTNEQNKTQNCNTRKASQKATQSTTQKTTNSTTDCGCGCGTKGKEDVYKRQAHNHDLHSVSSFPPDPYGIQLLRYRFRDDAKQQSSLSRCF